MPWAQVHWRSDILRKQTTTQVLLPSVGRPPFAALYLLHGLMGDSMTWLRHSRLEWYVRELPLVVVLPDGYRGFYTNNEQGPDYARHCGEELPGFIERTFPVQSARHARAIGGFSMGGYGALRVGLGYPERFCSVHSHSGALLRMNLDLSARQARGDPVFRRNPPEFFAELQRIFGRRFVGTRHDPIALVGRARRRHRRLPRILIDCGTEDSLLGGNRDFHRELEELHVPHLYREFPGGHDWDYWDLHIREALSFHAGSLHLASTPRVA